MLKYILLILLLLLSACISRYDVRITEVSLSHDENGVDIATYFVTNPTHYDLTCEMHINPQGSEKIVDEFTIKAQESRSESTTIEVAGGETRVILTTRCKPIN